MSKNEKVTEEIEAIQAEINRLRSESHSLVMLTTVEDWLSRIKKVNK